MIVPDTVLQGRYLVVRQLAQGGMGAVYEATDQRFGRRVALKQAFYNHETLRKAFEREARLLNDLRHPALPVVIDYFAENEGLFLVMDYVAGADLADHLYNAGRPFSPDDVLRWADQVLDALGYLHSFDPPVVHRDIKPQNLKLTPSGDVKLLDFGLAKGSPGVGTHSSQSIAAYTPHYAPLEQIQGAGTTPRSDLYALAATMYHLLTGRMPNDALERAMRTLNGQPDPLAPADVANPEVPHEIADVVSRAMSVNAEHRFASAAEMRAALRSASGSDVATAKLPAVSGTGAVAPVTPTAPEAPRETGASETSSTDVPAPVPPRSKLPLYVAIVLVIAAVAAAVAWAFYPRVAGKPAGSVRPEAPARAAVQPYEVTGVLVIRGES